MYVLLGLTTTNLTSCPKCISYCSHTKKQSFLYTALTDRAMFKKWVFSLCRTKWILNIVHVNFDFTSMQWLRGLVTGLLLRGRWFENGPINVTIMADQGHCDRFVSQYFVCSVNFIPPTFHTHLHLNTTVIRSNNGRSPDTFKAMLFHVSGWTGETNTFTWLGGVLQETSAERWTHLHLQRDLDLGLIKR